MSNDPGSPGGERPGWQGQQPPYPGGYGQPPAAPGGYGQAPGYGQSPPAWSQQTGQHGAATPSWATGPAGLGPGGMTPQDQARGFFGAVFDFSFNTFATPVVIRVLYILSLVGIGLFYIISVLSAFATQGAAYGLITLVVGGVLALLALVYTRVGLELLYAVVRIAEDVRLLRNRP